VSRRDEPDTGELGFALVETLIACAIMAAMMAVTYQVVQTSARATWRTQAQQRGVLVAQSVMARLGSDIALAPGSVDGTSDGVVWRVAIDQYRGDGANGRDGAGLLEVIVSVRTSDDRKALLDIRTLRLAS
jgi:general secretion pathway protein I